VVIATLEMIMSVRFLMAAVLVAATFGAQAASTDASPKPGFAQLDKNGDGSISRDEAANHARLSQNFDRIDINKDGALSQEELRAARPHRHHARVDANQDGTISRDEAKNAPRLAENFDAIDANKDGILSRDELAAWRSAHPRSAAPQSPVKP
jgi:Ca2+-binding EF-hand superfamily protein